jgi:hypothetical protein
LDTNWKFNNKVTIGPTEVTNGCYELQSAMQWQILIAAAGWLPLKKVSGASKQAGLRVEKLRE